MPEFFVTYGFGSNLKNCYSKVTGPDYSTARALVDDVTEGKFAFMYDAERFAGQVEKYGLTEVPLQPQQLEHP